MEFKELMQGFAERTGAEDSFLLDEDGVYRIGIDGFEVAFMDVPEKDSLLMWCDGLEHCLRARAVRAQCGEQVEALKGLKG